MQLPATLLVEVKTGDAPVAGALVQPVFLARHRNDFSLRPKLTDGCGEARWTADEIRAWVEETRAVFPQDFGEFDKHASGQVRVDVLGRRDIDWAEKAIDWIGDKGRWPEGYRETLAEARRLTERLESLPLAVEIRGEGGDEHDLQFSSRTLTAFAHGPSYERLLLADVPGYALPDGEASEDGSPSAG